VRRINLEKMKIHRADGLAAPPRSVGSFVNTMDGRMYRTGMTTCLGEKKTTTFSVNISTMMCVGCPTNHAETMWKARGGEGTVEAAAFLLTDQAYSPILPAASEQNCLKILRR
jgi:hypothetical protein